MSDLNSLQHGMDIDRRAWTAEIERLGRADGIMRSSISMLSDRIMELEDRVTKLEKDQ